MQVLVAYDVSTETKAGRRRLRRVAITCKNFGQRVQKSVFECSVNEAQYEELLRGLLSTIDQKEDNLRLYRLIEPKEKYVDVYGINTAVDFEGPLLV